MRPLVGSGHYLDSSDGMRIKEKPQEFIVEEITPEGLILEVGKSWKFTESEGDQLICILEKINWDTNRAIKSIAKSLHVSPKRIGFAGTKDKRAWTTQRISIWGISPNDLEKIKLKDIWIKPLHFSKERIQLGDLWGNRFTITIREISEEEMKKLKLPREFKIPNFFGIQRFGEKRPVTHLVGKTLVKGNLEKAVKTYLAWPGPKEREETREARKRLSEDWDWKKALEYFPKHLSYERTLLDHLVKHPKDYANALRKLPKNLLKMFVHGYQSYLFNKYLEKRLNSIGLEEVEGDVLLDGVPAGPLYGYELELANGIPGEIEKEILEEEEISLQNFKIKPLPEASSKGGRRPVYAKVYDYEILEKGEDWVKIRFKLEKGVYATTVLDWVLEVKRELPESL